MTRKRLSLATIHAVVLAQERTQFLAKKIVTPTPHTEYKAKSISVPEVTMTTFLKVHIQK